MPQVATSAGRAGAKRAERERGSRPHVLEGYCMVADAWADGKPQGIRRRHALWKVKERSRKGSGKVKKRQWKGQGKVKERQWKGSGKVVERQWKGSGKAVER